MSGYDPEYNIFELTATKAEYWFRRTDYPEEFKELPSQWDIIKAVLQWKGIQILKEGNAYMHVVASPEALWEVLSGTPSTPEFAESYYKNAIKSSSRKLLDKKP